MPATCDVFGALANIPDLMANERGLTTADQLDPLGEAVGSLDELMGHWGEQMTSVGARIQGLDSFRTSLETVRDSAQAQVSALEDADIADVATQLARVQTTCEMTLAATANILSLSLLDFLK